MSIIREMELEVDYDAAMRYARISFWAGMACGIIAGFLVGVIIVRYAT